MSKSIITLIIYIYVYIYVYIKWAVFVNVTTKSGKHAHARMIAIIVEKVQSLDFFNNNIYKYIYIYS